MPVATEPDDALEPLLATSAIQFELNALYGCAQASCQLRDSMRPELTMPAIE